MNTKRSDLSTPIAGGHANIVAAMKKQGIKRFITLATPNISADEDVKTFATVFPKIMARAFLPSACRGIIKTGEIVKSSGLDWSVVRIISPNAKSDGQGYGFSLDGTKAKLSISRANTARCMLAVAKDDQFIRGMPIVFNK